MKLKTFPVFMVFFAMGFGDVVGPLVGLLKILSKFHIQWRSSSLLSAL
ncbi:MAG: hypothetical protein WCA84_08395 [Ignavibacteriaceae bacterium]